MALWRQPRSKDMPASWFHEPSGVPDGLLSNGTKPAGALKKIISLSARIDKLLATAKPRDPLVADEIRTGLLGMRVMEEICLVLLARLERTRIKPPQPKEVAGRLVSLETRLRGEWLKRNNPSEYARIREVLLSAVKEMV